MDVKKLLLEYMPESKFFDMCNFIEKVYLMEYDLLILMARKFLNLFCVFHELNCQKYERLGIPYRHGRKIVANRALPLLRRDLQNGKYKKIVIADDIIIHGRSIREVYDELVKCYPEVDVILTSYMRNDQDKSSYEDIIQKFRSRYLVESHDEWRRMSDEIVNIFYISGRPYISYLPYFILDIDWDSLMERLQSQEILPIQDEDMQKHGVEAYMYTGKENGIFQGLKCCHIAVLRFYHYTKLDTVVAIPYFCMNVMEQPSLNKISDFMRDKYIKKDYRALVKRNNDADGMRVMELEYIFSTWLGMHVLGTLKVPYTWHRDAEVYSFSKKLLPDELLSCRETEERLAEIIKENQSVGLSGGALNGDIQILLKQYEDLKKKYRENYPRWKTMELWTNSPKDYVQRFIDNYLVINGILDEESCKKGKIQKKRLFGIPIFYFINDTARFLDELEGGQPDGKGYKKQVFARLLTAVDSGRGTIVTKIVERETEGRWNESVLYAGEQNYKFYEITNFPFMYSLYLIEEESQRKNEYEKIEPRKVEMVERFSQYLTEANIFYIKEEMLQIAGEDISSSFKKFLHNSYEKYCENPVLKQAVTMALDICSSTEE